MTEFVNRFAGTAEYYAEFRPGYPSVVYDCISKMAGLDERTSRMLDLGCGPGIIACALAGRVRSAIGVDLRSRHD